MSDLRSPNISFDRHINSLVLFSYLQNICVKNLLCKHQLLERHNRFLKFTNPKFKVEEIMGSWQMKPQTLYKKLSINHKSKYYKFKLIWIKNDIEGKIKAKETTLKLAHFTKQKGQVKSSVTANKWNLLHYINMISTTCKLYKIPIQMLMIN